MNQDLQKTLWAAADKLRSNMDAADYRRQKGVVEGSSLENLASFTVQHATVHEALSQLDQAIAERNKQIRSNWIDKATGPAIKVMPTAALILLSLILVPVLIKTFFYFVIAPLAARRPPHQPVH